MNILKHPIYKAIYDLCGEIENLPPSDQATKLVIMASDMRYPADQLILERDNFKSEFEKNEI